MNTVRTVLDGLAIRFPGGSTGNRRLTALLGALLLAGILGELATLALGLRQPSALQTAGPWLTAAQNGLGG